jgi:hypothetical protein
LSCSPRVLLQMQTSFRQGSMVTLESSAPPRPSRLQVIFAIQVACAPAHRVRRHPHLPRQQHCVQQMAHTTTQIVIPLVRQHTLVTSLSLDFRSKSCVPLPANAPQRQPPLPPQGCAPGNQIHWHVQLFLPKIHATTKTLAAFSNTTAQ